jgi:hypothetical protein
MQQVAASAGSRSLMPQGVLIDVGQTKGKGGTQSKRVATQLGGQAAACLQPGAGCKQSWTQARRTHLIGLSVVQKGGLLPAHVQAHQRAPWAKAT